MKTASKYQLIHRERHGLRQHPDYMVWTRMRQRTLNKTNPDYKWYGNRGIRVCDRWSSFKNFLEDMGDRPSRQHSIERIDVNGDYEPSNCKWATAKEQANNRRIRKTLSGFRGVHKKNSRWQAILCNNGELRYLGVFNTPEEASSIYEKERDKLYAYS